MIDKHYIEPNDGFIKRLLYKLEVLKPFIFQDKLELVLI
jgi:hypothetical protein